MKNVNIDLSDTRPTIIEATRFDKSTAQAVEMTKVALRVL
jgi:hypothetical protein